ncbi:uncharacterized protein P884DRAFT_259913 [Thermothelomyces heterothallicus CBS 202.75]|uniref:uncharacterized protein n=1 Tax=Thermothelomyces heterothallicus CBS 202.75 TaxID=1149848 RepID=UPI003743F3EA
MFVQLCRASRRLPQRARGSRASTTYFVQQAHANIDGGAFPLALPRMNSCGLMAVQYFVSTLSGLRLCPH